MYAPAAINFMIYQTSTIVTATNLGETHLVILDRHLSYCMCTSPQEQYLIYVIFLINFDMSLTYCLDSIIHNIVTTHALLS